MKQRVCVQSDTVCTHSMPKKAFSPGTFLLRKLMPKSLFVHEKKSGAVLRFRDRSAKDRPLVRLSARPSYKLGSSD